VYAFVQCTQLIVVLSIFCEDPQGVDLVSKQFIDFYVVLIDSMYFFGKLPEDLISLRYPPCFEETLKHDLFNKYHP
jgi:hypothetical protein